LAQDGARWHQNRVPRACAACGAHFSYRKAKAMRIPSLLQGESLTRLFQGIAVGAVATIVIGFYWGGWVTGGTAKEMAQKGAESAVVSALAPICVDKFQHAANVAANMVELKKISSWEQGSFLEKGGWATMAGASSPDSAVARACAEMLGNSKS
jgi:hypothetical protein